MKNFAFFFRLFVWFSLRHMRRHLGRALTVLFGIALGAAVFTSVRLVVNASVDSFARSMDLIAGRADYVLTRPGGYVPEDLIATLLNHPSIQAASPVLTTYIRLAQEGAEPFLLIGFDPILDRALRDWQVAQKSDQQALMWFALLKEPFTLIMGQPLADPFNLDAGDEVVVEHVREKVKFKIIGRLEPEGLALAEGGRVAITDIATFQEFTGLFGKVDRIDLRLKTGAASSDPNHIRKILPESIALNPPSTTRESGQGMIRAYQLNLSILSFASLFVGMFLVYSLVALNAASRRRELAILRSTGATAHHLFFIFLAEGAMFGVVGWLVALPFGRFLIKYLLHGVSQTISTLFVRVRVETIAMDAGEMLLSFAATVLASVLAAYQPAREAMQVSPQEALEISQMGMRTRNPTRHLALAGICCIALVWPLSRIPAVSGIPLPGYFSIFLLFVGFSMLAPWTLEHFGQTLSPFLRRRAGIPAYLAGRYVRDSGVRTAVSVGALITAVALFSSLVIMIYSFRQTVALWTEQTIQGDLFLTAKMGEINQFRNPLSGDVIEALKFFQGKVDMVPNRRFFLTHKNFPYEFELLDVEGFIKYGSFIWLKGDPEKILPLLRRGEGVIVSEVYANRTGLTAGDLFRTQVEESFVELPILGVVRDYRTRGGVVFYALPHFEQRYHHVDWGSMRIFLKDRSQDLDRAVENLRRDIIGRVGDRVDLLGGKRLRGAVLQIFDETFAVTTVLLLVALIIAALGIATTLTVMVLERSRQLNTLLAVGASLRQIRLMIFWEAGFMVVIGEMAGVICGFILSYLLIYVVNRQSFGWTFLYSVDWAALALSIPLIIITALAATLPAVRMVLRQPPAALLRER